MNKLIKNYNKEEWGGWKFVSEMLNNPNGGIYPTSKCYQQLYDFVCEQKQKAIKAQRDEITKVIEICQKIKDIEHKKMEIAEKHQKVFNPEIISWIQNIERILT